MYPCDPIAYTPCPPSKRRAQKPVTRDLADDTPQTDLGHASSDGSYHPSIVLSTPSRYTRPAHVGSTGPIPSSPPGGPMDQSVLYSPWCPGTPPLTSTKTSTICPTSVGGAERGPLLSLGVTLGQGRWAVGRVSGTELPCESDDIGGNSVPAARCGSEECCRDRITANGAWQISPVDETASSPLSTRARSACRKDAIDMLDGLSAASYCSSRFYPSGATSTAIAREAEFEPRYLDYPPAPRLAHCEMMDDPLGVPDYEDEFDFGYIPGYEATPPAWAYSAMDWPGSPRSIEFDRAPDGSGGLRSPWLCGDAAVGETRAFLLASQAEEGILSREGRMREANDMAGGPVCGLGVRF